MNKLLKLLLLVLLFFCINLQAGPEIVVQLRLYEGFSTADKPAGVIVSSYYLQKIPGENVLPFVELGKEKEKLVKIYHLKDVRQIANLDMILKKRDIRIHTQELMISGKKIAIQLGRVPEKNDRFRVKVIQHAPGAKPLMETEIIMPQNKTAVFGFKDPQENIYFLAFNRKQDNKHAKGSKLIFPTYPKEAVAKKLEGDVLVVLEADDTGRVVKVKVVKGHPLLADAAVKNLKQWQLMKPRNNKKAMPRDVIMVFLFRLQKPSSDKKPNYMMMLERKHADFFQKWKKKTKASMAILLIYPRKIDMYTK
jgi:TonB family protein